MAKTKRSPNLKVSRPRASAAAASTSYETASAAGGGVNAYDSAQDSPNRSSFVSFPTNSYRELTPQTRREIVKKARALEANCPYFTRIIQKCGKQAVGPGIHFRFITDDVEWNAIAQRLVEEWWNNKDVYSVDGSRSGWDDQLLAIENLLLDGEFFQARVKTANGWPMIQPLDPFEIETPPNNNALEWDDGVKIVPGIKRAVEYAVRSLPRAGAANNAAFTPVPAASMVHLGRRRRAHGKRFLPPCYSGLNMGIDALDLCALASGTAKLHSALAVQVKKSAKRGQKGAVGAISKLNSGEEATSTAALEKVFGSMINYVGENGEIDLKSSQHPTVNLMEFYRLLFHGFTGGFDLPFSVIWSFSEVNGTGVRAEMEDAQATFDRMTDSLIWNKIRGEIIWALAVFRNLGRIRDCKDPYWFSKIVFRGPRKLTVDLGRMATAFKTYSRNGALSIPRFLEEQNLDAYAEATENIRFLKFLRELAEKEGVPVEWVYEPTPGVMNNVTVNQPDPNA